MIICCIWHVCTDYLCWNRIRLKSEKKKKTNIIQKVNNIAIYPLVRPFIDSDIMTPSFRSFQSTFVSIISERTRKVKNCEYPLKKKEQTALIIWYVYTYFVGNVLQLKAIIKKKKKQLRKNGTSCPEYCQNKEKKVIWFLFYINYSINKFKIPKFNSHSFFTMKVRNSSLYMIDMSPFDKYCIQKKIV